MATARGRFVVVIREPGQAIASAVVIGATGLALTCMLVLVASEPGRSDAAVAAVAAVILLWAGVIAGVYVASFCRHGASPQRVGDEERGQAAAAAPLPKKVAAAVRPPSAADLIEAYEDPGGGAAAQLCAVCLDGMVKGETVKQLPPCRHVFHGRCIDPWLRGQPTCPTCRRHALAPPRPRDDGESTERR